MAADTVRWRCRSIHCWNCVNTKGDLCDACYKACIEEEDKADAIQQAERDLIAAAEALADEFTKRAELRPGHFTQDPSGSGELVRAVEALRKARGV